MTVSGISSNSAEESHIAKEPQKQAQETTDIESKCLLATKNLEDLQYVIDLVIVRNGKLPHQEQFREIAGCSGARNKETLGYQFTVCNMFFVDHY